ncbi:hypothetical protein MTR67_044223 [Solanum verrucosum]|uniref:CCHC-type domain-containing protein n=1 Tax=Solanum verrucosum TaxID=315347 RepID=A0AAF0ZV37_SOLVR|nr:hypothetical protein MTR67_044223 [Solanum verrucosum]
MVDEEDEDANDKVKDEEDEASEKLLQMKTVSKPKPQGIIRESLWPTCGKTHEGRCLAGMEGCFSCGESAHKMRNCPKAKPKGKEGKQVPPSGSSSDALKTNRFYVLD